MSEATELFTEQNKVDIILHPAAHAAVTADSTYYSMRDYHKATLLIQVGDMPAGATFDAQIRQATDTSGGSVKGIPTTATADKVITQLTDADDNKIVAIELDASELDVDGGFDCIGVRTTAAVDTPLVSAILIRHVPRFKAVGTTSFDEVVT
jgi:hypothetical protein